MKNNNEFYNQQNTQYEDTYFYTKESGQINLPFVNPCINSPYENYPERPRERRIDTYWRERER